jgi:hypothetical protein
MCISVQLNTKETIGTVREAASRKYATQTIRTYCI